jgi:hypothetical protein
MIEPELKEHPKHELELLWETDIPNLRPGMDVSFFTISPSSENEEGIEGFNGVTVSHVPLTEGEREKLKLKKREEPYKATYYFLYPPSRKDKRELGRWVSLLTKNSPESSESKAGESLLATYHQMIFPQESLATKGQGLITIQEVDRMTKEMTEPLPAEVLPTDILQKALDNNPEGEICFLIQHGTTGSVSTENPDDDRVVGTENIGEGSGDLTYYLINAINLADKKIAAIVDAGCSAFNYTPSAKLSLAPHIPYFVSQSETPPKMSLGAQFTSKSSVVIIGEKTYLYDWSKISKKIKEAVKSKQQETKTPTVRLPFGSKRSPSG